MDENLSLILIEALSQCWSTIRKRHPQVPPVVLIPAPNPHCQTNVLGHFAPLRWKPREGDDDRYHEVVVVAEHLNRSAAEIFETLLHEAAHALNFSRGIHDCSASQYHNKKFKTTAEDLGLLVSQVRHYGFAMTSLLPETTDQYAVKIALLDKALISRLGGRKRSVPTTPPSTPTTPGGRTRGVSRNLKATCACPFIIRASKKTLSQTEITCSTCKRRFQPC